MMIPMAFKLLQVSMTERSGVLCQFKYKVSINVKTVYAFVIVLLSVVLVPLPVKPHDPLEPQWTKTELNALLKKAAVYCNKLETSPYHYFCHQEITETLNRFPRYDHYRKRKKFISDLQTVTDLRYDYQILKKKDFLKEARILVEKNGKKMRVENARLKTRFQNMNPSLHLPVKFLSAHAQTSYHFKLLERINDKRGEILVLEARPRKKKIKNHNYAKIWLFEETGAVVRVDVDEKNVSGYHKLVVPFARSSFSNASLKVSYYFDVSHNGLNYPSKAKIVESFAGGAEFMQKFEDGRYLRFTGIFLYKDYHFFNIKVEPQGS